MLETIAFTGPMLVAGSLLLVARWSETEIPIHRGCLITCMPPGVESINTY